MALTDSASKTGFIACCKNLLAYFKSLMKNDWYKGVFCLCLTLLVPEYIAIALVLFSLIFFIKTIKKENLTLKTGRLGILLFCYIIASYFTCLYANNKMHSFLMSTLWLVLMIAYLYITTVLNSQSRLRIAMQTLTVVTFICGVISIIQYVLNLFGDFHFILNLWDPLDRLVYDFILPDKLVLQWLGNRSASTFNNPNLYALIMIILLPFGFYCLLTAQTKHTRIIHTILLLFGFLGMLFSFSRSGYLSLLLMLIVFGILNFSKSKISRWILLSICVLTVCFIIIPNPFMDRLSTISLDDFSISLRFKSWQLTWEAIKKQPIGYGIGSFNIMEILRSQQIQDIYDLPHCHNIILELFAEGGIITILIFTVKFFQVFISNIKLHRSKIQDGSMLGATLLAIACGFMLFGMGDFPLSTPKAILVYCMILAISDTASSLYEIKPLKTIKK